MKFSNIITLSDIINIFISLCTIISIILVFLTLREMKKQRKTNIMPNIILDFTKSVTFNCDNIGESNTKITLLLKNIGNGTAKNLKVETSIKNLNDYMNDNITISNNFFRLKFKDLNSITQLDHINGCLFQGLQVNEKEEINSILCETLLLGLSKCILLENYNKLKNDELIKLINKNTIELLVNIKYCDMLDNVYIKKFTIKISPGHMDFGKRNIGFSLELIKYE